MASIPRAQNQSYPYIRRGITIHIAKTRQLNRFLLGMDFDVD